MLTFEVYYDSKSISENMYVNNIGDAMIGAYWRCAERDYQKVLIIDAQMGTTVFEGTREELLLAIEN